MKNTLILTDNPFARDLAQELDRRHGGITIHQSPRGGLDGVPRLNVKQETCEIIRNFPLIISIHCKQIFPKALVEGTRCVNVHPGYNPHNRGWYPQVFSILNKKPVGVTIHEMDEHLDHGPIICRAECPVEPWDTSGSVYRKLMTLERELVLEHFIAIRDQTYTAFPPEAEGNLNLAADFEALRQIDLEAQGTFGEFIDRLRALAHDNFDNAYFLDDKGRKIFINLSLKPSREQ